MSLFSTRARYALRFMLEVYRSSRHGQPIAVGAVAARTGISRKYLELLVRPLKNAGLLRGRRGSQGGYQLARDASEITVCQVIEASVGPIGVSDCVVDPSHCERADYCECRLLFRLVSIQLRATLQNLTLVDMSDVRKLDQVRQRLFRLDGEVPLGATDAGFARDLPVARP